jgi:serine protease Do
LLMLDNQKIKDSNEFKELTKAIPSGKTISVLVQRQGNPIFLALKTGE